MTQESVTLVPGAAGRIMVSDLLPVIFASNDELHAQFRKVFVDCGTPQKYVRDFRTIRLHIGQRMGHTSAIGMLAKPGDLVVELTHHHALDTCSLTVPGVDCIGRKTLLEQGKRFYHPYPTIWISNFSLWPRTSMNEVRDRLIKNVDQRIVILG